MLTLNCSKFLGFGEIRDFIWPSHSSSPLLTCGTELSHTYTANEKITLDCWTAASLVRNTCLISHSRRFSQGKEFIATIPGCQRNARAVDLIWTYMLQPYPSSVPMGQWSSTAYVCMIKLHSPTGRALTVSWEMSLPLAVPRLCLGLKTMPGKVLVIKQHGWSNNRAGILALLISLAQT